MHTVAAETSIDAQRKLEGAAVKKGTWCQVFELITYSVLIWGNVCCLQQIAVRLALTSFVHSHFHCCSLTTLLQSIIEFNCFICFLCLCIFVEENVSLSNFGCTSVQFITVNILILLAVDWIAYFVIPTAWVWQVLCSLPLLRQVK